MNMKSLLSSLSLLCGLLFSACGEVRPGASPALCGDLESFAMYLPGDTTRLTGIRNRVTGDTLVSPQPFVSLQADSHVVRATLPNKRLWVYSDQGRPLLGKPFDSFVYVNMGPGRRFYLGRDYDKTYYYFPQRHCLLDVTGADLSGDCIVRTLPDGRKERFSYTDGSRL